MSPDVSADVSPELPPVVVDDGYVDATGLDLAAVWTQALDSLADDAVPP